MLRIVKAVYLLIVVAFCVVAVMFVDDGLTVRREGE